LTNIKTQTTELFAYLQQHIPDFVTRPAQQQMVAAIQDSLSAGKIAVVEGPTGTGKTLAYLAAMIPWVLHHQQPLVISSATVALQEQLLHKDLPLFQDYHGLEFTMRLAKGRGRYVCISRMHELCSTTEQPDLLGNTILFDEAPRASDIELVKKLYTRYKDGKWDGDSDYMPFSLPGYLWGRINNNFYACTGSLCSWYRDCKFFKERRKLGGAEVIIANHDLVLADVAQGGAALPPVEECFYVFDEAHKLPEKGVGHFAASSAVKYNADLLGKLQQFAQAQLRQKAEGEYERVAELAQELSDVLRSLVDLLDGLGIGKALDSRETVRFSFGKLPPDIADFGNSQVIRPLRKLQYHVSDTLETLKTNADNLPGAEQQLGAFSAFAGTVDSLATLWQHFLLEDTEGQPPQARWISRDGRKDYVLHVSPITVRDHLQDTLWRQCQGAVLTSATLSALGKFSRFRARVGLDKEAASFVALTTPFDLSRVTLDIGAQGVSPKQRDQHTQAMISFLNQEQEEGAILVLFTAKSQMQDVYDGIAAELREDVLMQGSMARRELLIRHQSRVEQGRRSVIFGLDSFAEGLDLPGALCTHVIIAKLPFAVPTTPVEEAGSEWLESVGRNYFTQVSVPDAAIKLTQACGRLMRKETDSGRITIMDNRLLTTRYGQQIMATLPKYRRDATDGVAS
jgi:ATP-dependent DNA helicase DinG